MGASGLLFARLADVRHRVDAAPTWCQRRLLVFSQQRIGLCRFISEPVHSLFEVALAGFAGGDAYAERRLCCINPPV
jgi:hypothetical protein